MTSTMVESRDRIEWRLDDSEAFVITGTFGGIKRRTIVCSLVRFGPALSGPKAKVYVEGVIVLKATGEPGTNWSGGYVDIERLPHQVVCRILANLMGRWHYDRPTGQWVWS